jgi:hypothetical protein
MATPPLLPHEVFVTTKSEPADRWARAEQFFRILSLVTLPLVVAVGGWVIQRELQDQAVKRDYVQIAVSILREPDQDKVGPGLRQWAVDLLNKTGPVPFADPVAKDLGSGQAVLPAPSSEQIQVTRSGLKLSGRGKFFSDWYVLCSADLPAGAKIVAHELTLSGDRQCGAWAECQPTDTSDSKVCYRFRLQGHDEWPAPGQGQSEGVLTVKYVGP